jgi:hypothetical protein
MKNRISFALALALAASSPAFAQTSTSGSNAGANSASNSGAASNQAQTQNNAGIGSSTSGSSSGATSGSTSTSGSTASGNSQQQGQSATNQQGTSVSNTFNSQQRRFTKEEVRTNAAIPLTASSSFSSDFCGSTTSGGASAAPLGVSIGFSTSKYDQTCRSLRVAEKAGMLAVSANNMGFKDLSARLTALATWSVCTANGVDTENACKTLALLGVGLAASPVPDREVALQAASEADRRAKQGDTAVTPSTVPPAQAARAIASPR